MKDSITGDLSYYKEMLRNRIMRKEIFMERIVDGSPVVWNSCLNMYHLTFSKEEAQIFYGPNTFHYKIKMLATDGIGVPLFEIHFTECEIVNLITNIVSQIFDISEFSGRETEAFPMTRINKSPESITDTVFIDLVEIPDFPEEIPFGESIWFCDTYNEYRMMRLEIYYYDMYEHRMMKSLSVPVSLTEALDVVDCLITIVSDIELPSDEDEYLKDVLDCLDYLYH